MERRITKIERAVDDFSPIPFYFINDEFDEEEVCRQLDCMKENGIKAFFFHVRDGLTEEAFGTDTFFKHARFVVVEAAKRGIKVWLYDEDAYPSGNCGGMTVIERPELQAQTICVIKVPVDERGVARTIIGKGVGMYGYILLKTGEVRRVENCFGAVRKTWHQRKADRHYFADMADRHFVHTRAATSYTEVMFEVEAPQDAEVYCVYRQRVFTDIRYGTQANCLDRRTTDYFIRRVHEKYREFVGEYFGTVIPGVFLDEPAMGGNAYCEELESYFEERLGYSPKEHYYKLSPAFEGDSARFRRDYARVVSELFRKNFLQPIQAWCKAQGLIFTGHFSGEENFFAQAHGGDLYRALGELDLPGMDLIGNDVGDLKHPSLLLGAKVVSSAAWQNGKDILMSESFALNPYNFGYEGLKTNADWLFACGVNLIIPHAFHYGYSAFRRADAGKSFFFQDPLFPEYKRFSAYAAKVGRLLHEYRAENRRLVVLPLSAFSEETLVIRKNVIPTPPPRMEETLARMNGLLVELYSRHADFDITYPESAMQGEIEDGCLRIGEKRYAEIIVVKGGEEERAVYERLRNAGASPIFYSSPADLSVQEELIRGEGIENLLILKKQSTEGDLYFVFNNGEEYVRFSFINDSPPCAYDAEKDEYLSLEEKQEFGVNGYRSLLLLTKKTPCAKAYEQPKEKRTELAYKLAPQRIFLPVGAKAAIADFDLTVEGESGKTTYKNVGFSRLRDLLGTVDDLYVNSYMVPYFDTAPRISAPYPVRATYSARIENIGGGILFDKDTLSGSYRLFFNGREIKKEELRPTRVYDKSNVIFYPTWKEGENLLEAVFEQGEEFDGINGEFFVME